MKRIIRELATILFVLGVSCHAGNAQRKQQTFSSPKRMTPTAASAAKLKKSPPHTWIRHYLGDDRYKIAGGVWKFVTTPNDRYYYRPGYPVMLSRSPNNVIGFASESEAQEAGYSPHFSVSDQGYGYSGSYTHPFSDPTTIRYLSNYDADWYGFEGNKHFEGYQSSGKSSTRTKEDVSGRITLSDGVSKLATRYKKETKTTTQTEKGAVTSTSTEDTPFLRSVFWRNRAGSFRLTVDVFQPYTSSEFKGRWDPDFPGVIGPSVWDTSDYAIIGFLDLPHNYDITGLLTPRTFKTSYARLVQRNEMQTLLRTVQGAFPSAGAATSLDVRRTVIGGWPGVRLMPVGGANTQGGAAASGTPDQAGAAGAAPAGASSGGAGGGTGSGQAGSGHGPQGDTGIPLGANIWIVGNVDVNPPKLVLVSAKEKGSRLLNSLNLQPTRGWRPKTVESVIKEMGEE